MKLDDFQRAHPYEAVLAALRNPEVEGGEGVSEEQGPRRVGRLHELLEGVRRDQLSDVASLLVSPVLEPPATPEVVDVEGLPRPSNEEHTFALRDPRSVARRFVSKLVRDVRVSGLDPVQVAGENLEISADDRTLAAVLSWMVRMEAEPKKREPLEASVGRALHIDPVSVNWTTVAGLVLGPFVARSLRGRTRSPERADAAMLAEALTYTSSPALPQFRADRLWAGQLISEGASKLRELGKALKRGST